MYSSQWIIPNTTQVQFVDYPRMGRSMLFMQYWWSGSQKSIRHFHISSRNAPDLPPPPHRPKKKFCLTFVFHFSWVLQPSQEKLKTKLMQNFGGQIRCIMWKMCTWQWSVHHAALSDQVSWAHAMTRGRDERPIWPFRIWRFMAYRYAVLWCGRSFWVETAHSNFPCLALGRKATPNNEKQNRIKWPWSEHRLHRKGNNKPKFT